MYASSQRLLRYRCIPERTGASFSWLTMIRWTCGDGSSYWRFLYSEAGARWASACPQSSWCRTHIQYLSASTSYYAPMTMNFISYYVSPSQMVVEPWGKDGMSPPFSRESLYTPQKMATPELERTPFLVSTKCSRWSQGCGIRRRDWFWSLSLSS